MATFVIVTREPKFTATPGQTHHPVVRYLYGLRKARANRKPPTRVDVKCSLVDDDVFWHNLMLSRDYKLPEVVTRLYSTNDSVNIGWYLQAVIVIVDVAKAGTHDEQCQSVITSLALIGVVIGFLEALSQVDAITVPSPMCGWL